MSMPGGVGGQDFYKWEVRRNESRNQRELRDDDIIYSGDWEYILKD